MLAARSRHRLPPPRRSQHRAPSMARRRRPPPARPDNSPNRGGARRADAARVARRAGIARGQCRAAAPIASVVFAARPSTAAAARTGTVRPARNARQRCRGMEARRQRAAPPCRYRRTSGQSDRSPPDDHNCRRHRRRVASARARASPPRRFDRRRFSAATCATSARLARHGAQTAADAAVQTLATASAPAASRASALAPARQRAPAVAPWPLTPPAGSLPRPHSPHSPPAPAPTTSVSGGRPLVAAGRLLRSRCVHRRRRRRRRSRQTPMSLR